MAISFLQWVANGSASALTIGWPTTSPTYTTDDICFLVTETSDSAAPTLTTASGFQYIGGVYTSGTNATRLDLWWCRATSASMPSVTIGTPVDHVIAMMFTVRGCTNVGEPWDTSIGLLTQTKTTASTTTSYPTTTTVKSNCETLYLATNGRDTTLATWTNAQRTTTGDLNSYTFVYQNSPGNGGGILGVFPPVQASPGSTGTITATMNTSLQNSSALLILIETPNMVTVNGTDTGTGTDSASVTATAPASDVGPVSDQIPAVTVGASESASVSESARVIVAAAGDVATEIDSAGVLYAAQVSDTATGTDAAQSSSSIQPVEAGSISESATVIVRASEATSGGDTVVPMNVNLSPGDAGAVSDTGSVLFTSSDSAQGVDSYGSVQPRPTDVAAGSDSARLLVNQLAVDTANVTDAASVIAYATADMSSGSEGAFIFIEGVGVIGARVVRIPTEARVTLCAKAIRGGIKLIPGEARIRLLGKESRTVKVVPQPRARTVPRTEV